MVYGSWAMRACTMPALRSVICLGPVSKAIVLTLVLPACFRPVATPSAVCTFVAKMPIRSGWAARVDVVMVVATDASYMEYWSGSTVMFGWVFISSLKPLTRAVVVVTPGCVVMTMMVPLSPMSVMRALAAR